MLRGSYAGVVAAAVALAGCGGAGAQAPCMELSGASDVVARAAVLVLDVYGPPVDCAAAAAGAVSPLTQRFLPTDPITFAVPPGPHTILLRAFADSAATVELGSGCAEVNLAPGAQVCVTLDVAAVGGDAAVASDAGDGVDAADASVGDMSTGDLSTVDLCSGPGCPCAGDGDCIAGDGGAPLSCCGQRCVDTATDPLDCGGCGVTCDQTHSVGATCAAGVCAYGGCAPGWGDCDRAGADGDGCETDLAASGQKLCGGVCIAQSACCSVADCTARPAPAACYDAACAANSCSYPLKSGAQVCGATCCLGVHGTCSGTCALTCSAGFGDCNGSVSDGCEAALDTATNCNGCGKTCRAAESCFPSCCAVAIPGNGSYQGDTSTWTDEHNTSQCGSQAGDGPDVTYALTATRDSTITVDTCKNNTFDTIVYVRTACDTGTLDCSDDATNCGGGGSRVSFAAQAGVTYYVIVDGYGSQDEGPYTLTVSGM